MADSSASNKSITKIWTMNIKSSDLSKANQGGFDELLHEILTFCKDQTEINNDSAMPQHQFWEEASDDPSYLVMITGYSSMELNMAADKEYVARGFIPKMAEYVDSGRLLLCERDVSELPLNHSSLRLDIYDQGHIESENVQQQGHTASWDGVELIREKEVGAVKLRFSPVSSISGMSVISEGESGPQTLRLRKRLA